MEIKDCKVGTRVKWIYDNLNYQGIIKDVNYGEIIVDFAPLKNGIWLHDCNLTLKARTGRYFSKDSPVENSHIKYLVPAGPKKPLTFKSFFEANKNV